MACWARVQTVPYQTPGGPLRPEAQCPTRVPALVDVPEHGGPATGHRIAHTPFQFSPGTGEAYILVHGDIIAPAVAVTDLEVEAVFDAAGEIAHQDALTAHGAWSVGHAAWLATGPTQEEIDARYVPTEPQSPAPFNAAAVRLKHDGG